MTKTTIPWLLTLLSISTAASAADCSRADIDHYLKKGFSHAQVMELCSDKPGPVPTGQTTAEPPEVKQPKTETDFVETTVFLQTAIDAEDVSITPDHITLTQERCFPYGELNFLDMKPAACAVKKTRIKRQNMEVGDVVEERFLIRDGELMVRGEIHQTFEKTENLKKDELKGLQQEYPATPAEYNIPVKKSMKRKKVAEALKKLSK